MCLDSNLHLVVFFVALIGFGCADSACEKCGPCWDCGFADAKDASVGNYGYSAEDVLARTEGTWVGEDIEVTVMRTDGGTQYRVPLASTQYSACELPDDADDECAGMRLGADVLGMKASHSFKATAITVSGDELVLSSMRPEDAYELRGFPMVVVDLPGADRGDTVRLSILFGPDALWARGDADTQFNRVGTRQ